MRRGFESLLLASVLLLGTSAPTVVRAATTDGETAVPQQTGTTKASAVFKAPTTPATPVDPNHPDTSVTDTETNGAGKPEGATGLALVWAPKTLDFGTQEINFLKPVSYTAAGTIAGSDKPATAGNTTSTMKTTDTTASKVTGVQVSDERGTNNGWHLTVVGTALTLENTNQAAKGVTVTLPAGALVNSGAGEASDNGAQVFGAKVNMDGSSTGVKILSAGQGYGAGTTVDKMNPSDVTLDVPANAVQAGTYTGSLTWTLTDGE